MKELTMDLACELSIDELQERAQKMSSAMIEYDELEDRKKSTAKNLADEMASLRDQMRLHSVAIRRKSEIRPTVCYVRFHVPEMGMKRIVRKDTGEVVRDEVMTYEERQANLFDDLREIEGMYGSGPQKDGEE